jgi:hypothetical protein
VEGAVVRADWVVRARERTQAERSGVLGYVINRLEDIRDFFTGLCARWVNAERVAMVNRAQGAALLAVRSGPAFVYLAMAADNRGALGAPAAEQRRIFYNLLDSEIRRVGREVALRARRSPTE